ncbi:hypothetical protein EW146_g2515 [Bondarzewia mesenterica]|uniref:Cellobiose dehydrogenase-like cytochrome domain-containing protein n=1 Tax=Bondarzewia mesenterica TaxID=1095465 RepID=A0A4S4M1X1_9AGAM|nr:hypothetical protein EW146_g2515 [Bondarzewia mesenterica]
MTLIKAFATILVCASLVFAQATRRTAIPVVAFATKAITTAILTRPSGLFFHRPLQGARPTPLSIAQLVAPVSDGWSGLTKSSFDPVGLPHTSKLRSGVGIARHGEGGSIGSGDLNGFQLIAYVTSTGTPVDDPSNVASNFTEHNEFDFFSLDLSTVHSSSYSSYIEYH